MTNIALAASAVVIDAVGRVLVVKRGKEPSKGCWSVPGGRVEADESLAEAAVRETFEETGLKVEIVRELGMLTVPTGDGRYVEIHDFLATATGGVLVAGDDAEDVRWVGPDELRRLPVTAGLIEHLEQAALIPRSRPRIEPTPTSSGARCVETTG